MGQVFGAVGSVGRAPQHGQAGQLENHIVQGAGHLAGAAAVDVKDQFPIHQRARLCPGDLLVLLSDGVQDAYPDAAALASFDSHLAGKSAASLSDALAAARGAMLREVRNRFAEVEQLYLDRLMKTRDANEGLSAFLAKRKPSWEHC